MVNKKRKGNVMNTIKLKKLTDSNIKVGDAYHVKSHQGQMIEFVYEKKYNGWVTIE